MPVIERKGCNMTPVFFRVQLLIYISNVSIKCNLTETENNDTRDRSSFMTYKYKKKMGFLVYTVSCSLTGHCQEGILAVGMSCNGCCYCGEVAVEERLR